MAPENDELLSLLFSDLHRPRRSSHESTSANVAEPESKTHRVRRFLQVFLSSKYGHYFVFILVGLDVICIFADFLISLHMCEHAKDDLRMWTSISEVLDILSLVFSCLFMAELLCSIYAFGLHYFSSKFHIFDALSILASFFVDVFTHGILEEAGSLIIVLRLFRVFKIVEESSTVAEESLEELREKVAMLERENRMLRQRHHGSYLSTRDV